MKLIRHPDPWLEKAVDDFDFDKMDAADISRQMIAVMRQENGIGLSANQVGLNAKIFVMQPQDRTGEPFAVINPMILEVSNETTLMEEGCLSFPKLYLKITRPSEIIVKYLDTARKECIMKLEDLNARVFLHEFDHLLGINFINRVSKMKLQMAQKKLTKVQNG